jgi:transcriptional regulator with XRE-family HTH domain
MPRSSSQDVAVGQRIRDRRTLLRWTVRYAADRAGISHSTLSRIERGEISADNRITLARIAEALKCPVTDLTGLPQDPVSRDQAETGGAIYETVRSFVEADLDYPPESPAPPWEFLTAELELVRDLRVKCDYAGAARRLPLIAHGLHTAASGDNRAEALRSMVLAADTASFIVRYLGHPGSACLVADRAQQAAEALEIPSLLGLAAWDRAHAATGMGLYNRALAIASRAATELEPHYGTEDAPEMLGQLYMLQAYSLYALGRKDDALDRVAGAEKIASRTGDSPALRLKFGPTNITFWRISMEADGDSPGRAVELARITNPAAIESIARQAAFYADTARALARTGADDAAIRMMATAYRLAPQRTGRNPLAKETVRGLLERATRGRGRSELHSLAERMGIGA